MPIGERLDLSAMGLSYSYLDAQGFKAADGSKLASLLTPLFITMAEAGLLMLWRKG